VITAIVGSPSKTNLMLAYGWRALGVDARVLWPSEAEIVLTEDDVALLRLDVLPTLDGVEPGLEIAQVLERRGVRMLNPPGALLAAHDKLLTAELLSRADVPHPWTIHLEPGGPMPPIVFPCVLKPRFGSWGQDVFLCRNEADLTSVLAAASRRPWWSRHGAIMQEFVGPAPRDVRVLIAGERVVAGAQRVAAPGEWRTNVTLGGRVTRAEIPEGAEDLAHAAARALGIHFAGVDLLPSADGWLVLELNGAVDFDLRYALPGIEPFAAILNGLGIDYPRAEARPGMVLPSDRTEVVMEKTVRGKPVRVGDEIEITGHAVGDAPRTAEILEILGEPGHERFRVRWEDGHESIFFPAEDAVIRRPRQRRKAKAT